METVNAPVSPGKQTDLVNVAGKLSGVLSENIFDEENNGRLSPTVVNALRKAQFYKLYLPESLGGLEADPLTVAQVVEEVSKSNTAAAWSLMVANTTLTMAGRLPEKGVGEIFIANPEVFVAGSVHPPMRATAVEGGYLVNGRNALVSNVHEADWIMFISIVMEADQPKIVDGHPVILGVYMDVKDCSIIDTWSVLGMRATDSNDVEAKDVFVPNHRTFVLTHEFHPNNHFRGPLYLFPTAGSSVACLLAPVSLGVARNAITELKALADKKTPLGSMVKIRERGVVQRKLGRAEALVQSARAYLHSTIAECWNRILAGETNTLEHKADLLLAATHANQSCLEAVELVYTAAGTNGIYLKNKLAHYFTDAQVLRLHGFMNESRYETAGQVHFGLAPDLPIITF